MSAPPSRSELEKALRAKKARRAEPRIKRDGEAAADTITARRRKPRVLGGDLGGDLKGVTSKSMRHFVWAKINSFGVINVAAFSIVSLILLAFFWPQDQKGVTEVALEGEQIETKSFYTESRADEIPELNEGVASSFLRDTDIPRAEDFREQDYIETRSKELLELAEGYLIEGNYTLPQGRNAADTYREILELNPTSVDAKRGLKYINGRFLSTGTSSANQGNFVAARSSLNKLAELNQDSDEYAQLAEIIETAEKAVQIERLLERASTAFASENYILPAQNNAWSFYKQVLELAPNNEAANAGVENIANTYIELANTAALAGQYQAAAGYLATVGVIAPENPSIEMIEAIVSRAQPLSKRALAAQQQNQSSVPPQDNDRSERDNSDNGSPDLLNVDTPAQITAAETIPAARNNVSTSNNVPTRNTNGSTVSQSRTPEQEASEQAAFDRQYLERGLAAYYQGDYASAAALLKPLADKGISRAQFRIAYMHFLGRGFPENRNEADRIIRAALPAIQAFAAEGRAWAQSDLGSLYEDGLVLPRDYKEAFFWYRASAEQGYAGAQTNLGILYARGLGVSSSRRTAIEWFEKAAAQGDAAAVRNLESLNN